MSKNTPTENTDKKQEKPKCGIILPISEIDGLSKFHWAEVLSIHTQAIEDAGFEADLVSNAEEVGIIQKTIIQNLYENPVVVCDVSAKNPNVMFELGMRLAFDKPTIIVKDDKTTYSFDTAPIEHLHYPRDLRFAQIVDFKATLGEKVKSTYKKATEDPSYTTFLKNFGEFKVAKIDQTEVSAQDYILDELRNLQTAMTRLERSNQTRPLEMPFQIGKDIVAFPLTSKISHDKRSLLFGYLRARYGENFVVNYSPNHVTISLPRNISQAEVARLKSFLFDSESDDMIAEVDLQLDDSLRSS